MMVLDAWSKKGKFIIYPKTIEEAVIKMKASQGYKARLRIGRKVYDWDGEVFK